MVTPNPQGRDRQSSRCSTISRPKSDGVTAKVTVSRLRRDAGVTAQPSAATPFQPVRSRQAVVAADGPTASAAPRASSSTASGRPEQISTSSSLEIVMQEP
jgi:hypothetical protein